MEAKDTPLQEKLESMAGKIGYFGMFFAVLTIIAMIVSWFVGTCASRCVSGAVQGLSAHWCFPLPRRLASSSRWLCL